MHRVSLVAHRGRLTPADPENSLAQMQITASRGVSIMEIDLRQSRDGTIYLLHDAELDRTTTGSGLIGDRTDQEIAGVHLKVGRTPEEPITRFEEALHWAASTSRVSLMLDLKAVKPEVVIGNLTASGMIERAILLTFSEATAREALAVRHRALVSVLVRSKADIEMYRAMSGDHRIALYINQDADPSLFSLAHKTGLPVISDTVTPAIGGSLDQRAGTTTDALYRSFLAQRPTDILVTDRPLEAEQQLLSQ